MVRKTVGKLLSALLVGSALLSACKAGEADGTVAPSPADMTSGSAGPTAVPTPAELQPEEGTFAFVSEDGKEVGPSPTPSPSPTPEPTPEDIAAPAEGVSSYDVAALRAVTYTDEQMAAIAEFYSNTVFTGDSVLLGFNNYCARSSDPVCSGLKFLSSGSYSLHNAFRPVSDSSIHPLYQGVQYPLWESVPLIGPNRLFLFFGINDVSFGVEDSLAMYPLLIDNILAACPDLDITILSATYTLAGAGKGGINNENLSAFNSGAAELCAERGWGFLNLADALSDGQGNLKAEYCSDGFVHETNAAYEIWEMMIKAYAAERLGFGSIPGTGEPETNGTEENGEEKIEEDENNEEN
ncbi:MAG: hypothetical protein IK115_04330 [Lachnospiraceae bacterium]|nr:hypothetical protein [Lachnospiraceae bacterium]